MTNERKGPEIFSTGHVVSGGFGTSGIIPADKLGGLTFMPKQEPTLALNADPPKVPVGRPYISPNATNYMTAAVEGGVLAGTPAVTAGKWLSPNGPWSAQFARLLGEYTGSKVTLTNSGTSALEVAIRSVATVRGVSEGTILVPAYTCPDCAVAVIKTGFTPFFVDVGERMVITASTMNAALQSLKTSSLPAPVGVMPIHLWGMTPDLSFYADARKAGLFIIDDMAEAFGAKPEGHDIGDLSDAWITSLRGDKPLPVGVGGVVMTRHEGVHGYAQSTVGLSSNGGFQRLFSQAMPLSYEFPEVMSALGVAQLEGYDLALKRRWDVVEAYDELGLTSMFREGDVPWKFPIVDEGKWAIDMWKALKADGIETTPPHTLLGDIPFLLKYRSASIQKARKFRDHSLALPILPDMTRLEIERVVSALKAL